MTEQHSREYNLAPLHSLPGYQSPAPEVKIPMKMIKKSISIIEECLGNISLDSFTVISLLHGLVSGPVSYNTSSKNEPGAPYDTTTRDNNPDSIGNPVPGPAPGYHGTTGFNNIYYWLPDSDQDISQYPRFT